MVDRLADEALADFLRALDAQPNPPPAVLGVEAMRAAASQRAAARPQGPDMASVRQVTLPTSTAARLYLPTDEPSGLVLFLHGGGWVIGDLETHDRACRRLAATSGAGVLALDYRRAPEHRWPAAVDDAVDALTWIHSRPVELEGLGRPVAVVGDSAGGTTAALACLRLRDSAPEALPDLQVLVYANTDLAATGGSMSSKAEGYGLDAEAIAWFYSMWVPDAGLYTDPRVSPLRADDLSGLPPAVVVTCEHDPLRDQGEAYADRLTGAGVPTTLRREEGMVHNFLLWDMVSASCAAAGDRVAHDIARAFRPAPNPSARRPTTGSSRTDPGPGS